MEQTTPKTFVFVLMPFSEKFIDVYKVGIKPACKDAGAYCERVDEQIFVENILERVYNQIAKADLVVSEMTGRNPNVFYETGYAHALNKRVILLTQNADDIPFDLKHYPHIVYGESISVLKDELEKRVRWSIENPKNSLSNVDLNLEFTANGKPLDNNPQIDIIVEESFRDPILNLGVGIHNTTAKLIRSENYTLDLIMPGFFKVRGDDMPSVSDLPNGLRLGSFATSRALFPDGWHTFRIGLLPKNEEYLHGSLDFILRFSTELGAREYPFKLRCLENITKSPE